MWKPTGRPGLLWRTSEPAAPVPGARGLDAFTLVELLLTVTLILLLAGAAALNFDAFQRGSRLEEGATLVESLFRYARAQSASSGRMMRVEFDGETLPGPGSSAASGGGTNSPANRAASPPVEGIRVVWEPDPLAAPGHFETLREAHPFTERLNELVEVRRVRTPRAGPVSPTGEGDRLPTKAPPPETGSVTNRPSGGLDPGMAPDRRPIGFYPDGSSDTVEVVLGSRDPEDSREVVLTLSGGLGTTRRRWVTMNAAGVVEEEDVEPAEETGGRPEEGRP